MLHLITPVNINVIIRLRRDAHSDSIPNVDFTNPAFFYFKFVGLYLCFTSLPQACYSSIFGLYIMDAVWVSQGGVWLLGLQASQRDRVREGKRDIESGRLTESLSQALATKQKREIICLSAKEKKSWQTVTKPQFVTPIWHRIMWNTLHLGFWSLLHLNVTEKVEFTCSMPFWCILNKRALFRYI